MITEAAWLLRAQSEAVAKLLSACHGKPFRILDLGEADLDGTAAILGKYRSLELQLADAALLHLLNREGIETIFTLDRRDFRVLRSARGKKVHIIP